MVLLILQAEQWSSGAHRSHMLWGTSCAGVPSGSPPRAHILCAITVPLPPKDMESTSLLFSLGHRLSWGDSVPSVTACLSRTPPMKPGGLDCCMMTAHRGPVKAILDQPMDR